MPSRKPLTDAEGKVRELKTEDLSRFRPVSAVAPPGLARKLGVRGPQKSPTKERITIRLSPDVLRRFRATGAGWQTRVDAALKDWLESNKLGA